MALDSNDWKRIEELVHQAGGVANTPSNVPDGVRADAMAFHTLGLAILDIHDRLAELEVPSNKSIDNRIIVPNGY